MDNTPLFALSLIHICISTINAMLLVSSQIVSQDLILINGKGRISEKKNMILSRTIVFTIAAICGIMALNPPETLVQIEMCIRDRFIWYHRYQNNSFLG